MNPDQDQEQSEYAMNIFREVVFEQTHVFCTPPSALLPDFPTSERAREGTPVIPVSFIPLLIEWVIHHMFVHHNEQGNIGHKIQKIQGLQMT